MGVPTGRLQFFVLEATDYLERLVVILRRPATPDADELIRLTRALRGAALMAGLPSYAQAAAGLEHLAKTLRETPADWGPHQAEAAGRAVDALRALTDRATGWSEAENREAAELARTLAGPGSVAASAPRGSDDAADEELKASVRAFIGREGSMIGGTLEHAAHAIELGQVEVAAQAVLPRLQPLRGLAALPRLSPLPEFLDAIELTLRAVRPETIPPDGPRALRRAAAAVTQLAREIADSGRAGPDAPEVVLGAVSLLESFGSELDVVDIGTLFPVGDANPVVRRGIIPEPDEGPDPMIELVSLADRFRQAADQLIAPTTATGRTLFLYGLLIQLRPLTEAAPRERPHLADLLDAVSATIGQGRATRAPAEIGALLRDAAERLAEAATTRNAIFLGDELAPVVAALRAAGASDPADDVVPIESLAPDRPAAIDTGMLAPAEPEPVAIESLAPADPEPVAIESLAPDDEPVTAGLFERSFSTYHRLTRTGAADNAAPPRPAESLPLATDVVPVEVLLIRGRRALERADRVRRELSAALSRGQSVNDLHPLVSELIDLVPLALEE